MLKHFAPAGLNHFVDWRSRFKAIGFENSKACRAALSRAMRRALVESRFEHLPAAIRTNLNFVVDVGTNLGQWVSALMIFGSVGRIEAFEPNPEVFEQLQARFRERPHTCLHQLAVGEAQASTDLNITRSSDLSSILVPNATVRKQYSPGGDVIKQMPVKVVSLDDIIRDDITIDLMKIDVQGAEHSVLRGAGKTLKRTRALLVESNFTSHYVGDGSFGSLFTQLTGELGFDFWDVSPPYRGTAGQALWTDAVFLNPNLTI